MKNNIWKTMDTGKVYETLAKMTPEQRLSSLKRDTAELYELIAKNSTTTKQKVETQILEYIQNYILDMREEYEDMPFPDEAMLQDSKGIIGDMVGDKEFFDLIKEYMRVLV